MKIQGVLTIEGVKLHVDIDALDDDQDLYVTNVHPNCLVIPKERWRVEFLGLPPDIVEQLQKRGIGTLDKLVNGDWHARVDGFDEASQRKIAASLAEFLRIAFVFNYHGISSDSEEVLQADTTETTVLHERRTDDPALNTDIAVVGLLKPQEETLRNRKGMATLGDLVKLGRSRLLMTDTMDERGVQKIEVALRERGLELSE
ncbi:hypothetical protein HY417_04170 [Candidatus Kaiserbacteria bacterium]|nr:hypothetical protein [Candidatus Kaiserbacteria bacterium]